ncbi:MAG: asparagine synthase (glutamine-hydrolyzing) [Oscillospiraceae bacterium]
MCGFVGFTGDFADKEQALTKMMDRIIHRGPDMSGQYIDDEVALGFRRLSILDVTTAGTQPMYNEDKTLVCVFNGEIYNFRQLREELEALGHVFTSHTDTEVLVHGYEAWGETMCEKLEGMFAFVIYDTKTKHLFGARDHFGIKPFYYCPLPENGGLLFGSEIKSFLDHPKFQKELNENALRPYLTLQYSATEETFFKGVYKLLPGHSFTLDTSKKEGEMTIRRFWKFTFQPKEMTMEQGAEELDKIVHASVEAQRVSDVKVGSFLSGGVDSSYITTCLMPEDTFSVGFAYKNFDETAEARALSERLGVQNVSKLVSAEECFGAVSDIQYHMDEPQSNPSCVPLWFLAKLAREHVTVVLSGEGADELFGGYVWYQDNEDMKRYKKLPLPLRRLAGKVAKKMPRMKGKSFLLKCAERPEDFFVGQALVFPEDEALDVLQDTYKNGPSPLKMAGKIYKETQGMDEVSKMQNLDMQMWMPGDILLKADKMCMAHSLELRVPFLDQNVGSFAETVPANLRICGDESKAVLRHASAKTLPAEWANRTKKGFPVPIRYWLREEQYYNLVKDVFQSDYAGQFFHTEKLVALLDAHFKEQADNGRRIWTVYTFLVWYKRFFIDEK